MPSALDLTKRIDEVPDLLVELRANFCFPNSQPEPAQDGQEIGDHRFEPGARPGLSGGDEE